MLGDTLKRTRLIYGYKAKDMSKLLNISPSYLSEIENNKKNPTLEILEKYADIYGMKLSSLILLSEDLSENQNESNNLIFVKKIMTTLIDKMSNGLPDDE